MNYKERKMVNRL